MDIDTFLLEIDTPADDVETDPLKMTFWVGAVLVCLSIWAGFALLMATVL